MSTRTVDATECGAGLGARQARKRQWVFLSLLVAAGAGAFIAEPQGGLASVAVPRVICDTGGGGVRGETNWEFSCPGGDFDGGSITVDLAADVASPSDEDSMTVAGTDTTYYDRVYFVHEQTEYDPGVFGDWAESWRFVDAVLIGWENSAGAVLNGLTLHLPPFADRVVLVGAGGRCPRNLSLDAEGCAAWAYAGGTEHYHTEPRLCAANPATASNACDFIAGEDDALFDGHNSDNGLPGIESVVVSPHYDTVAVSGTVVFSVDVDATPGVSDAATWYSTNESVATVHPATGVATGVAVGTASICAQPVAPSNLQDCATLTVTSGGGGIDSLVVEGGCCADPTFMSMTTFSAAVYSSGGVLYWPVDSGGYTLSSSDTAVATLTSSGLVVGHTIGTTEICATSTVDPSKSDCAEFHVLGRVNNVAITDGPSSIDDENPGQFYASVYVDQSSLATVPTSVRWYTDTPTIATVDASGLATAVSTGTATICAVSTYSEWAYEATQPYVVNLGWSTIRFDCVEVDVSVSVRPRS